MPRSQPSPFWMDNHMPDTTMAPAGLTFTQPREAPAVRASIVVLNYNGRRHLDACLGSLVADCRPDYEIILFDNASTDGSADFVEAAFPAVRVIRGTENAGYAGGNNAAAAHANGEYLVFLNPDTVVRPGWLEALLAAFQAGPRVGLATSQLLMLREPERVNTCGTDIHCSGLTLCRGAGGPPLAGAGVHEVGSASGAAFAIRRDLFERLGGFDHNFFMYMEDTDLSWRARLAGYKCVAVPSSVVYHDYTLRFGPNKTFYQERNRYLMLLKTYRWPTLLALLPTWLLAEVVSWGFVLTRDRARAGNKLHAYAWIVRHWRGIQASRGKAQAVRRVPDRALIEASTYALAFEQVDGGPVARLAHLAFDPLFLLCRKLALAIVRW